MRIVMTGAGGFPGLRRRNARLLELVRFLLVGGLNTLFGYGLFALLYLVLGDHRVALALATVAGVLFNFATTGRIVFGSRRWSRLPLFVAVYAASFGLNLIALDALVAAGLPALFAQLAVLPGIVILSFLANRHIVFREGR